MKILLTGSAGFIGSSLLKFLSKKNFKIYAIYNKSKPIKYSNVNYIKSDLKKLKQIPKNIDCVIHAAVKNPENTYKKILFNENINSSKNIFKLALKFNTKKIIYFSSIAVYEKVKKYKIRENDLKVTPRTIYAKSKYVGEKLLQNISKNSDISTVLIRLPTVIGRGSTFNAISQIKKKILRGEKISVFNPNIGYNRVIHINTLNKFIYTVIKDKKKILK